MKSEPFDLQAAWSHVATLCGWILNLLNPADIGERVSLLRDKRRELLAWLGPAEALARRVLLLKALSLPKANLPPAHAITGKLTNAFTDRTEAELTECLEGPPETWRVRFRVMPSIGPHRRLAAGETSEREPQAKGWRLSSIYNAIPLARRIEALRRVLDNPEPAVKRLVRLLATRRADIVHAFGPYRPPHGCARTPMAETQAEIDLAFNTS
jgi:hypothetical protein